ncbi:MAG: endo-1,4-beta-xylanase [Oscillospiraceae bacterium]|nr:endo-1,4-beta-xylanase [Oscillospiraceae bacterium]
MTFKKMAGFFTAAMMIANASASAVVPASAEDTVLHSADFENGTDGWASFGGTSVTTTNDVAHNGKASLYISGRTESWQGASLSGESILQAGKTYQFNAWVQASGADTIQLTLKYTDSTGSAQYKGISSADSVKGTWSEISASYDIPADATDILIYFQTSSGTANFMVDDVTIKGEASWSTEALDRTPLKDVYAKYFKIGCAATPAEINTTISQDIVKHHFNSLTPGNELKPDAVLNQAGSQANGDNVTPAVSLDAARYTLKFCEENHIPVRGHVLCWYSQTPDWFFKEGFRSDGALVSKDVMNQRLENYIKAVLNQVSAEFPNLNVYCWDVVNECYLDDGSLRKGGTDPNNQESYWSLIYGDNSYIENAFTYARKYAPEGTKLFYNDFNEYIPAKRDAIYNMVADLKSKNLIDGIGMQSHLDVGYPDANLYKQCIEKFNQLGLEIQVTELDITDYDNGADSAKQVQAYHDIVNTIVEEKKNGANITALVFWGITDGTSWRKTGYPLLLNSDYSPKQTYNEVEAIIPESEWGKAEETTQEFVTFDVWAEKGDVNLDGVLNVLDIIQMQKWLLGKSDTLVTYPEHAEDVQVFIMNMRESEVPDMNDDEIINIYDLLLLKHKVLYAYLDRRVITD